MKIALPEFLDPGFLQGLNDEEPMRDVPDPLQKFIETAELRGALGRRGNADALAAETQGIDRRARDIYKTLAAKAQTEALTKSAPTTEWDAPLTGEKVARIEKTVIGSTTVVAEFDSRGVCIRTYKE